MTAADARRERQKAVAASGRNLVWGTAAALPRPLQELVAVTEGHPAVRGHHSGLTAEVWCLELDGVLWNLKKKRDTILVKNDDGQLSFLNEIEQRITLERFRDTLPDGLPGIVRTVYADLKAGIILSRWIDGDHVRHFTRAHFRSLFDTLFRMDQAGIMEYDLCSGNLLETRDGTMMLFDFGYAYPYDPLTQYNGDGLDLPLFHPVERFESRVFMQYLLDLGTDAAALALYREEKEEALVYYRRKREWLAAAGATRTVLDWVDGFIRAWEAGLVSQAGLADLYALESFRSYIMDLNDDLHGQSCTPATLRKADRILEILETRFDFLQGRGGLFWGDEKLSREALVEQYTRKREDAVRWQLS